MNERIKERNEIAKGIIIHDPNATVDIAYNTANGMMEKLYGKGWDGEPEEAPERYTVTPAPVTIEMEDGKPKGVRVRTLDVDFTLALQDLEGGDCYSFDSAQEKLKELGLRTFNKKEALAVAMYIEEINKAMEEVGGKPFEQDWYTTSELFRRVGCADYIAYYSWYFGGTCGCVNNFVRYYGSFRCRPCLA